MERNTWKYVVAALACAAIITLIVVWISSANDREMEKARDCDLMGVAMLNGKPYKCSRLAPDSPTTPDPGQGSPVWQSGIPLKVKDLAAPLSAGRMPFC